MSPLCAWEAAAADLQPFRPPDTGKRELRPPAVARAGSRTPKATARRPSADGALGRHEEDRLASPADRRTRLLVVRLGYSESDGPDGHLQFDTGPCRTADGASRECCRCGNRRWPGCLAASNWGSWYSDSNRVRRLRLRSRHRSCALHAGVRTSPRSASNPMSLSARTSRAHFVRYATH
jgi:hypothetical protein